MPSGPQWAWGLLLLALCVVVSSSVVVAWHRRDPKPLTEGYLRAVIVAPATRTEGLPASVSVRATTLSGTAVAANVSVTATDSAGKAIATQTAPLPPTGTGELLLPSELPPTGTLTLKTAVRHQESALEWQAALTPLPAPLVGLVRLDQVEYTPGTAVRFAVDARRLAEGRLLAPFGLEIALETEAGQATPIPAQTSTSQATPVTGQFDLPAELPAGAYRVSVRQLPARTLLGAGRFQVRTVESPAVEKPAAEKPANSAELQVRFQPEGGALVIDLESRVYLQVTNAAGKPVEIEGQVLNEANREVAVVRTNRFGRGLFRLTPTRGDLYRLRITKPAGPASRTPVPLPFPQDDLSLVVNTGPGVFVAEQPVAVTIRSKQPGVPLVVALYQAGQAVEQQPIVTDSVPRTVRFPAAAWHGVLDLVVFDARKDGPLRPIAQRSVYRLPAAELPLAVTADPPAAAGQPVTLTIGVKGLPAGSPPAAVFATARAVPQLAAKAIPPVHALTTAQATALLRSPVHAVELEFGLSDDPLAMPVLDSLLAMQPPLTNFVPHASEKTETSIAMPLVRDNFTTVHEAYVQHLKQPRQQWSKPLAAVSFALSLFGLSAGAVLFLFKLCQPWRWWLLANMLLMLGLLQSLWALAIPIPPEQPLTAVPFGRLPESVATAAAETTQAGEAADAPAVALPSNASTAANVTTDLPAGMLLWAPALPCPADGTCQLQVPLPATGAVEVQIEVLHPSGMRGTAVWTWDSAAAAKEVKPAVTDSKPNPDTRQDEQDLQD